MLGGLTTWSEMRDQGGIAAEIEVQHEMHAHDGTAISGVCSEDRGTDDSRERKSKNQEIPARGKRMIIVVVVGRNTGAGDDAVCKARARTWVQSPEPMLENKDEMCTYDPSAGEAGTGRPRWPANLP